MAGLGQSGGCLRVGRDKTAGNKKPAMRGPVLFVVIIIVVMLDACLGQFSQAVTVLLLLLSAFFTGRFPPPQRCNRLRLNALRKRWAKFILKKTGCPTKKANFF